MRILFVTPYVPSVIRVRPFNFIRELSKRHEITVISLAHGDTDTLGLDEVSKYCEKLYAIPLSKAKSLVSCCRRLLTSVPLQAAYTDWPPIRDFVARVAGRGSFDLLHVEHIRGAHLAADLGGLPKVYDSVDCITRLLKQFRAHQRNPIQRLLIYEELLKMRSYEPRTAAKFDRVVITSQRDKRALQALIRTKLTRRLADDPARDANADSSARKLIRLLTEGLQDVRPGCLGKPLRPDVTVVRNGVDSEYFRPVDLPADDHTIVFAGKMSYFANVSAALHFYRNIFPRIRLKRPDAKFKIVGNGPPDCIRKLGNDPAVTVTGYVPDMRPQLGSAAVVVCPLTIGVGIQNKVLEAMAMGKPVVSTSVACGGIPDAVSDHHLICADGPEEFADEVVRLVNDPGRRLELGENACRLVRTRYSWEVAARALEEVHAEAADMHRSRLPAAA